MENEYKDLCLAYFLVLLLGCNDKFRVLICNFVLHDTMDIMM